MRGTVGGTIEQWMAEVTDAEIADYRAQGHPATDYEIRLNIARSWINPHRIARYEAEQKKD